MPGIEPAARLFGAVDAGRLRDLLADRMKGYEDQTRLILPRQGLTVIRVDGRSFGQYTRRLAKPFDPRFSADMNTTALALAQQVSGTVLAYVQSDEISLIVCDYTQRTTQPWVGGSHSKIVSLTAAIATAAFNRARANLDDTEPPLFDSRAFPIPADDAGHYLRWRQIDARRNSLAMICDVHLGKKVTVGKNTNWRYAALAERGVDLTAFDLGDRVGRIVLPSTVTGDVSYTDRRTGLTEVARDVVRRVWAVQTAPDLGDPDFLVSRLPVRPDSATA